MHVFSNHNKHAHQHSHVQFIKSLAHWFSRPFRTRLCVLRKGYFLATARRSLLSAPSVNACQSLLVNTVLSARNLCVDDND